MVDGHIFKCNIITLDNALSPSPPPHLSPSLRGNLS